MPACSAFKKPVSQIPRLWMFADRTPESRGPALAKKVLLASLFGKEAPLKF